MSGRLSTRLCRYEPRLLSRSTTTLKPSSKTCCSIVSRTFDGTIAFCFSLFVVRLRDEAASVSTGGILIRGISRGEMVGQPRQERLTQPRLPLYDAVSQKLVFSREQFLHQLIAAPIHVAHGARKMMIDSRPRRSTEANGERKNFIRGFTLAEQPLGVRTGRADRK